MERKTGREEKKANSKVAYLNLKISGFRLNIAWQRLSLKIYQIPLKSQLCAIDKGYTLNIKTTKNWMQKDEESPAKQTNEY